MQLYACTCTFGLESVLKKEISRLGYKVTQVYDRCVFFEGDEDAMIFVNLWSRVAHRVWKVLHSGEVRDFDDLFDLVSNIDWKKKFMKNTPIRVTGTSLRSELTSIPAIQKTAKKAIVLSCVEKEGDILFEDKTLYPQRVEIFIKENYAYIMLDTSGEPLHKRGYRTETVEAPLKETLAVGIVLLSGWKFREPLYDFFCGSGTIAIEAAMVARNIAPGLKREFLFEYFPDINKDRIKEIRQEVEEKKYEKNTYEIHISDQDESAVEIAKKNAENAGVTADIQFSVAPISSYKNTPLTGCLISNPPYGDRLEIDEEIYETIQEIFEKNPELHGSIITKDEDFNNFFPRNPWSSRKLYNGGVQCRCFKKNLSR